jgi:hypothetical protein
VKITVDPAIMPLHEGTVSALVSSPAVAGKAAREILHIDVLPNANEFFEMQWLSEPVVPRTASPAATGVQGRESGAYDEELIRQMSEIYGAEYMKQFELSNTTEPTKEVETTRPGAAPRADTRSSPDTRGRGRTARTDSSPYGAASPTNIYGGPVQSESERGFGPSATVKLTIQLPPEVSPAAQEFMRALVENLRTTLYDAYSQHITELEALLRVVESRRHALETGVREGAVPDPAEKKVKEQLDTIVDLSVLEPAMPAAEAMEVLRKSVDPPLQIVVLWRDLEIMPASPIEIGGLSSVRLATALEVLLQALSAGRPQLLSYQIKGNVITIATAQTLGGPAQPAAEFQVEVDVTALAAEKTDLTRKIQALYVDLATQEAREKAISKQIAIITEEAAKRADRDEIARELENLVQISTMNMVEIKKAVDAGRATPTEMWQAQESLTRAKIEFARRREELSKSAGGGQLEAFNKELSQMAVERAAKETQQAVLKQQLARVERDLARASAFDAAAARTRVIREALDIMARRMADLQTRIANLQPPMVTMIGAN